MINTKTAFLLIPFFLLIGRLEATPFYLDYEWEEEVLPQLEYYCFDCHGDGANKGGVSLDQYESVEDLRSDRELWLKVEKSLKLSLMPPIDEEQLQGNEEEKLLEWINEAVFPVDGENLDPGPSLIRRLNVAEYENTINDLLGIDVSLHHILPQDDTGYGYDNISEVLTISPTHLDKYFKTAEIALDKAFSKRYYPSRKKVNFSNQNGGVEVDSNRRYIFPKNGQILTRYTFPKTGEYEIRIQASGLTTEDGVPPLMQLDLNKKKVRSFFVTNSLFFSEDTFYVARVQVPKKEELEIAIALENKLNTDSKTAPHGQLHIQKVEVVGPFPAKDAVPPGFWRIVGSPDLFDSKEEYLSSQIAYFLSQAFRGPPSEGETGQYVDLARSLVKGGSSYMEALRSTYLAVLVSPKFLFREGASVHEGDNRQEKFMLVDEFTLANRLSYFLWSIMPDAELFRLAELGQLRDKLDAQINRMIESPNFSAFIENYIGQWLQLRDVIEVTHSKKHFPNFSDTLQPLMKQESEALLGDLIAHDLPLINLLSADYTFLNERLAAHYGVKGVKGKQFRKVKIENPDRHGLLGHGSFLMLTSHPDRSSPVLRGKYVIENLLNLVPPPPPQDANQLTEQHLSKDATLRQQLEKHREDPACASCHNLMDPIGFGLERFNAVGQEREEYSNGKPISTAGALYRGERFNGPATLREQLTTHYEKDFYLAAIENMLIYATGRGMEWYDRGTINSIYRKSKADKGKTRTIIKEIIHSAPFQKRRVKSN